MQVNHCQLYIEGSCFGNERDSTKYLGVQLQHNLSWNRHINQIAKKGNSMLGFLRRYLKVNNEATKTAAYLSLSRPDLEYCCTIWSPHTQKTTQKLVKIQHRAARYVINRYRNTSSTTHLCARSSPVGVPRTKKYPTLTSYGV